MSLRYQINLRILMAVIILLLLGVAAAIWQARLSVSKEVQSSVNLTLQLIKLGLADTKQTNLQKSPWLHHIMSIDQTRHVHIQIQQASGQRLQIKNSHVSAGIETPPEWFIWAVSDEYPIITYELPTGNLHPPAIIISADPLDEISEAWQETVAFFLAVLMLSAGLFLAVNLAFKQVLKAVNLILHELNEIEQEHYRNRLPTFSILEFEQIARAINHLTETLAKAKQENSALTLHSLQIQEEEREYLAQELHDELGQSLTAIKVMAVTGKREGANVTTIHDSIISICDHLFAVVRSMMKNLHPLVLTELGLKASLEDLLAHWRQRHPEINFSCHCESALDKVDQRIGIQIFRVIQECITNTVRHADARNLTLHLNVHESGSGKTVGLAVKDDGVGCDLSAMTAGFGLLGIKARVKSLGGEVQFISTEAQGMVIQASIPVTG